MPRIRTVKPEFWEDELLGVMPRDARLLFIATFNMADDEGILRWTPAYIKAQAFMYDDDLTIGDVDQAHAVPHRRRPDLPVHRGRGQAADGRRRQLPQAPEDQPAAEGASCRRPRWALAGP
jgi:hypothetical protein